MERLEYMLLFCIGILDEKSYFCDG